MIKMPIEIINQAPESILGRGTYKGIEWEIEERWTYANIYVLPPRIHPSCSEKMDHLLSLYISSYKTQRDSFGKDSPVCICFSVFHSVDRDPVTWGIEKDLARDKEICFEFIDRLLELKEESDECFKRDLNRYWIKQKKEEGSMLIRRLEIRGFGTAIKAMRLPYKSGVQSDSYEVYIGPKDRELAMRLVHAGPDHRKFLRLIDAWFEIQAPLY